MSVTFSQMPDDLITAEGVTFTAVKVWHYLYIQTLGRPGWDHTYQQIAEGIGGGRRTVIEAVNWLVEKGWLMKREEGSGHAPNAFSVCRSPFTPWSAVERTPESDRSAVERTPTSAVDRTHQEKELPGENTGGPLARYMEWRANNGLPRPDARTVSRLGKSVKDAQSRGIANHDIEHAIREWHDKGLDVSILDSIIDARIRTKVRSNGQSAHTERIEDLL